MMTYRFTLVLLFVCWCQSICAQQSTIALDEVTVTDSPLARASQSQAVVVLNDSVIARNPASLTGLLSRNTLLYFKENGLGMVSSVSFRGTTAQQTAVVWNGINVNSQLNGQTDFNTLNAPEFNSVSVRAGGGSVLYGSGAVGGTVNLNNNLEFAKVFQQSMQLSYGSYDLAGLQYRLSYGSRKWSVQSGISGNYAQNDYPYPVANSKNENGQYRNLGVNLALGYEISARDFVKFHFRNYAGERHFSLVSPTDNRTKYAEENRWSLLAWDHLGQKYSAHTKLAWLTEQYRFYENADLPDYSPGRAQTLIARYEPGWDLTANLHLGGSVEYTRNEGRVSGNGTKKRDIGAAALLLTHQWTPVFRYEIGLRKESTTNYNSPWLYSAGVVLAPKNNYTVKARLSRNFRIPTFNDLYWDGLGNPNLAPETALQGELSQEISWKRFRFSLTAYRMKIDDMIRWVPTGGLFRPENTNSVKITGIEAGCHWQQKIGQNHLEAQLLYGYSQSENAETGKQLIYVPFHKASGSLAWTRGKLSANLQHVFTDKVYTQTDNSPSAIVPFYNVTDASVGYDFGKNKARRLSLTVRNLWNEEYQSVEGRWMPPRNCNLTFTFIF